MHKLQPIRRRKAGLGRQEGGSRGAADTEGEEAEHARGGGRGGNIEVGRQREMHCHSECVCEAVCSAVLHPLVRDHDVLWSCDVQIHCRSRGCR